ncbi:methyl-accepting chemotaxis protein [Piscinibacter sakaiensis]|uniref:Methyl-accepting chemotaxis protein I n=1 Tax=Piscinibacter sakaiensis TaxID=1547922 RepID=A0A0K8P071_PISS1|nr:methyl-accepting chemotaxis protein [Piscinibacter sakaiensis]GAP36031.1 methyl-accepting chemotaxis protein I [Piscinibacter sakaiensis]
MFASLKITTRLRLTLALLALLSVAMAALAAWEMGVMRASTREIATHWLPTVETINAINTGTSDLRIKELRHVMAVDERQRAVVRAESEAVMAATRQHLADYRARVDSAAERALLQQFEEAWGGYLRVHAQMLGAGPGGVSAALLDDGKRQHDVASALLERLIALNRDASQAEVRTAEQAFALAARSIGIGVLIALLVAVLAGEWLVRSIGRPLAQAVATADRVAAGDFTGHVEVRGQDEAAQLLRALSRMQAALAQTVLAVRRNAEGVATASTQIAQGNLDLSQRTEEQASALQQTAATMEQLGTTVRGNADSARLANQLAKRAADVAAAGGQVVGEVVTTMHGIHDAGRRIGDIIGVIDGIAFQTNILALNAAVEAARAGSQGRGFAVVATEVRALAQRSAQAAREIKALVGGNLEQVAHGSVLVDRAGRTMAEIVGSVGRVSDLVAEITAATVEQGSGISQVGDAVNQMDQVTQQNAALVEESAAAAESLRGQAQNLVRAVAAFRLAADPAEAPAVAQPAAA